MIITHSVICVRKHWKIFCAQIERKGCGSMAKRMSWCTFLKIVVVGKRPILYGLCAYEHVFEGMSGNTLLFYTGTSLYWAFFGDKTYFACSKMLKFFTISLSTSKVTYYCDCFCFNKLTYNVKTPGLLFEIFIIILAKS